LNLNIYAVCNYVKIDWTIEEQGAVIFHACISPSLARLFPSPAVMIGFLIPLKGGDDQVENPKLEYHPSKARISLRMCTGRAIRAKINPDPHL